MNGLVNCCVLPDFTLYHLITPMFLGGTVLIDIHFEFALRFKL